MMADLPVEPAARLMQLGQALFGRIRRQVASVLPRAAIRAANQQATPTPAPVEAAPLELGGTTPGWLRVCNAAQLLEVVQADKALQEIFRKTRFSRITWERDCLSGIRRYAEFVQLLPASEAHHHAHAGGLLAHTLEMLLAALAWRSGRMLPEGAPIELIDAQRDEWTLVVFYCALLHDIAKPMTDLKVSWRSRDMADPLGWHPTSGALTQVSQGRSHVEYLVEFTPKALRDYRAHSRLAMLLLPHIAPPSALAILARTPAAFECLNRYLSSEDQDSLVARIVREADRASTRRALQSGSRARFASASAVPLVDLLMQALQDMLRHGTALPLNRTGAAGWVFDGSIWFVAKRLADATRDWIKTRAPDEAVPGEAKNDRLFDTWQEYGCLMPNPQSGQAIWYVTVHGAAAQPAEETEGGGKGVYAHALSMLRFPLDKVFGDPAHYPSQMLGHIEVHAKRVVAADAADIDAAADASGSASEVEAHARPAGPGAGDTAGAASEAFDPAARGKSGALEMHRRDEAAPEVEGIQREAAAAATAAARAKPPAKPGLKAPEFNKRRPQREDAPAAPAAPAPPSTPAAVAVGAPTAQPAAAPTSSRGHEPASPPRRKVFEGLDDEYLLDPDETAQSLADQVRNERVMAVAQKSSRAGKGGAPAQLAAAPLAPSEPAKPAFTGMVLTGLQLGPHVSLTAPSAASPAPQSAPDSSERCAEPAPVLLQTRLPQVPGTAAQTATPPGPLAVAFIRWVQASLVERSIKYNETGAVVHFVPLGMALVSPIIFKLYAQAQAPANASVDEHAMQVQRELIRANLHVAGPNRTNIISFEVVGRGDTVVSRLSAVVLAEPSRWVQPVPPSNPVLRKA